MSVSRHPIALRLERRVGAGPRLLATVMGLPLVDGLFPALVLAGALDSTTGILEVGLLVFGGSATLAVVLAEMDGTYREQVAAAGAVGALVVGIAVVETALAPTIGGLLDLVVFERFAALVVLTVAAETASARIGEYLPRPAIVVGLGLVASVDPAGAELVLATDPSLVVRGGAAAGVGAAFAVTVAVLGPWLRDAVDLDRFRFGSAVALGVLSLSVLGVVPSEAPLALAVLGVATLLALDPGGLPTGRSGPAATDGGEPDDDATDRESGDSPEPEPGDSDDQTLGDLPDNDGTSGTDADRAPWL